MSAATAGVIVQPKIDTVTSEDGVVTYTAEVKSEGRVVLSYLLSAPLILVGFGALMLLPLTALGTSDPHNIGGTLTTALVVCFVGVMLLKAFASAPRKFRIYCDAEGITVGGRTYLRKHITDLGWRSFGNARSGYGQIYIQYGAEDITIISPTQYLRTESICLDFERAMKRAAMAPRAEKLAA